MRWALWLACLAAPPVPWSARTPNPSIRPAGKYNATEEAEYEVLMARVRTAAAHWVRRHGQPPTDEELGGAEPAAMERLSELVGMRGRNWTIRGPCPANCQGQGTCDHFTSTCACNKCSAGHDCSLCEHPCDEAGCGQYGRCDCCTGQCVCTPGHFGADCSGLRTIWDESTQCDKPCASGHGYRLDHGKGRAVCDEGYETRTEGEYCAFKSCPNDCHGHGTCNGAGVCLCQ